MKTCKLFNILMILALGTFFASCSSDDDKPSEAQILQGADGIIKLSDGLGNWDGAYLTKLGYFCYKEDAFSNNNSLTKSTSLTSEGKFSSITYMTRDGDDIVTLLTTKEERIPTQMVTKSGIVYFSFPNDSILELVYDDGKTVTMLDSIPYLKNELPGANIYKTDAFKATLANTATLLKTNMGTATENPTTSFLANEYGSVFEEISNENYTDNSEIVAGMNINPSGDYTFTETISNWYDNQVSTQVYNTLSLWTGNASFKVGGSSCTLSGTIFCPSNIFNDYGTYGIICDENQEKLDLENAEYKGKGYQSVNDLSYSVDFRGFKPNTTYYYRAYYKFNSSDHGGILPKYGNPTDSVIYDTTIKTFKTGDNILTVDVVMCIDVTGSMSGIINTVKNNALGFYDLFKKCCEEEGIQLASLNTQVIAFRDKNVDTDWLQTSATFSLPDQQTSFKSFVNGLYASGGGDAPESGLEALQTAFSKTDWGKDDGYHRQVVILWTDAPFLVGSYSDITLPSLQSLWNAMPSGRRLILFAPYGTSGSNSGTWGELDEWTNLIHETNLSSGFSNFEYILKSIIGELTSKAKSKSYIEKPITTEFLPNN